MTPYSVKNRSSGKSENFRENISVCNNHGIGLMVKIDIGRTETENMSKNHWGDRIVKKILQAEFDCQMVSTFEDPV